MPPPPGFGPSGPGGQPPTGYGPQPGYGGLRGRGIGAVNRYLGGATTQRGLKLRILAITLPIALLVTGGVLVKAFVFDTRSYTSADAGDCLKGSYSGSTSHHTQSVGSIVDCGSSDAYWKVLGSVTESVTENTQACREEYPETTTSVSISNRSSRRTHSGTQTRDKILCLQKLH